MKDISLKQIYALMDTVEQEEQERYAQFREEQLKKRKEELFWRILRDNPESLTIEDKMTHFEDAFDEYGYSEHQRELFKRHIMDVWPDGSKTITETIAVEPIYLFINGSEGVEKVKGFCPIWTTREEWWKSD